MAGVAVFLLAAFGIWVFWGADAWRNRQQDQVLSELTEVVEENAADVDATGDEAANTAEPGPDTTDADGTSNTNTSSDNDLDDRTTADDTTNGANVPGADDTAVDTPEADDTAVGETTTTESEPAATTSSTAAPSTSASTSAPTTTATTAAPDSGPAVASFEVIETIPHDTGAFTQGLEISNGRLFESTGLVGRSSIRELDLATGQILRNVAVPEVFGEGLTIVGDTAIQLTWQDEIAFRYDLETFDVIESYEYEGQGWGLCLASEGSGNLVMSDGSSELEFRDPDTFASLGSVEVLLDGSPILNLNELECIGDTVWANIWLSSLVIEIDPATGDVLTVLDIDSLRPESTINDSGAVWNGLAYDPSNGTLLVTGKLWPTIFRLDISS